MNIVEQGLAIGSLTLPALRICRHLIKKWRTGRRCNLNVIVVNMVGGRGDTSWFILLENLERVPRVVINRFVVLLQLLLRLVVNLMLR